MTGVQLIMDHFNDDKMCSLANACDANSPVLFMHAISLLHINFGLEFKMVRWKASEFVQGLEFEFLHQNCSHRRIQKALKEIGPSVSLASIHYIPHATCYILQCSDQFKQGKSRTFKKRHTAATGTVIGKTWKFDNISQSTNAKRDISQCELSIGSVNHMIKKILNAKLKKKCKDRKINESQIQKRCEYMVALLEVV